MGNFASIAAVGKSIERLLTAAFADAPPVPSPSVARAVLVRTEDLDPKNVATAIPPPAVSIYTYRVDFNKAVRAGWSSVGSQDGRAHLPVDLHFLLTAWANDAETELKMLGRAMQCLETTPVLSGPLLHPSGQFAPNETVQLLLEEISTEAVMRTFDSLPADYKLSVPYIARVVRIDALASRPSPPVLMVAGGPTPVATP